MSFRHNLDTFMSIATVGHVEPSSDGLLVPLSDKTERSIEHLFDMVAAAVAACADRLESLSIFGPYHLTDIGHALSRLVDRRPIDLSKAVLFSSPPPPPSFIPLTNDSYHLRLPKLRTFSSMLSAENGAMPFLVSACSEVQRWEISGLGALHCMENIPRDLFPALEEFEGLSINLKDVTHRRKVWNVSTINSLDTQKPHAVRELLEGLKASAVPILNLSINTAIGPTSDGGLTDVELIQNIALAAPSLRYLELFSHGTYAKHNYTEEARRQFAQALAVLTNLEEFHWWDGRGGRWGAALPEDCFEYSGRLKKVFINKTRYDRPQASLEDVV